MIWLHASGVWRDKVLGRSVLVMLGVVGFLIVIFVFLVTNNLPDWAWSVKYFVSDFFGLLTNYLAVSLTCLGGGVLISWIVLLVGAIRNKNARLAWTLGLIPLWIG